MPRSEKNTLVTAHATKVEPGYLVELAKEVTLPGSLDHTGQEKGASPLRSNAGW